MIMQQLPDSYSKNGYRYYLEQRNHKAAIYSQYQGSLLYAYEVFRIKIASEKTIKEIFYPEHERIPGNEDFGKFAFTIENWHDAQIRYDQLTHWKSRRT